MVFNTWQHITIEDFVTLQRGHDLPEYERKPGTVPVMGSFGITGFHNEAKIKGPGVTIGRSGVGSFGVVNYSPVDYWPLNTVLYVTNFHQNDELFVYYFFKAFDFEPYNSGSAQSSLNRNYIYPVPIKIPPLPEQKAIAHILGTIDDKIELNREMNQTLEAMARAIFKSWFVDFDPVRAKMEGRIPAGMDAATAELFPDEFEESALGMIPKGWRVGNVSHLAQVSSGKRPNQRSSEPTPEKKIPVYGGGGIMAYVAEPLYTKPILVTGRVGTLGLVFRISSSCWTSDNTLVIVPNNDEYYEYLYFHLREIDFKSLNRGSTQPLISQSDLKQQEFIISDNKLISIFHCQVSKLFAKVDCNEKESHTLTSIRDTLLPKLLSGEIRIKEAENLLSEVM